MYLYLLVAIQLVVYLMWLYKTTHHFQRRELQANSCLCLSVSQIENEDINLLIEKIINYFDPSSHAHFILVFISLLRTIQSYSMLSCILGENICITLYWIMWQCLCFFLLDSLLLLKSFMNKYIHTKRPHADISLLFAFLIVLEAFSAS